MYAPLALGASVWHLMNSVESPQHGPYRSLEGRPSTRPYLVALAAPLAC